VAGVAAPPCSSTSGSHDHGDSQSFARDLVVQETGHRMLKGKGIEIIAADSHTAFVDDTPTATFVRQVPGAVAQLDKAMTVAKLRGPVSGSGA
jgi:hypothetical protein